MDLSKESSGATRILTARHISSVKLLPEPNTETNTTLLCETYSIEPDFQTYIAGLQNYAYLIFGLSAICELVLIALYCWTVRAAARAQYKQGAKNIAILLSVYPIVGLCAFLVILLPRVRILAEAIAQEAVMIGLYYFYCFIIAECGGKEQMVRRSGGAALQTRVLPCCCWPCCLLPTPQLHTKHLKWIGFIILQMPIVQAIIYLIVLILWSEDMNLYINAFSYLQPFIAASILTGVWGVIMSVKAGASAGLSLRPKFLVIQLAVVIVKLQSGLTKALPNMTPLPCPMHLHPVVFANLIQSCVMQLEMLFLSAVASRLYRGGGVKRADSVQHVVIAVLDDKPRRNGGDKL